MNTKFNVGDIVIGYDNKTYSSIWVDVIRNINITEDGVFCYTQREHVCGNQRKSWHEEKDLELLSIENMDKVYSEYKEKIDKHIDWTECGGEDET